MKRQGYMLIPIEKRREKDNVGGVEMLLLTIAVMFLGFIMALNLAAVNMRW